MARGERGLIERGLRRLYLRTIARVVDDRLLLQRLKLPLFILGYWRLLVAGELRFSDRLDVLNGILRVDWHMIHGHLPREVSWLVVQLLETFDENARYSVVEAGCWRGGSAAKLSLVCGMLGYELHIYDSFRGVERVTTWEGVEEWEYGGQYAAPREVLEKYLREFGDPSVREIHEGWFSHTLAKTPVPGELILAYIDCDLAKATEEALSGIVPSLVRGGVVFSHYFHIEPVCSLIGSYALWGRLGVPRPTVRRLDRCLARIEWPDGLNEPAEH